MNEQVLCTWLAERSKTFICTCYQFMTREKKITSGYCVRRHAVHTKTING